MALSFLFPDVGEGIHEGRIVEWLVAEGDTVAEDQPLLKVETDKAVVEIPSPHSGVVLKIRVAEDSLIHVGDELILIGEEGEKIPDQQGEKPAPRPQPPEQTAAETPAAPPSQAAGHRPPATPRTRALARRLGVDLKGIKGSGRGGRITDEDVEKAAAGEQAVPRKTSPQQASKGTGEIKRVPITHLRKVIASAMRRSRQISAHVTHVDEADVTPLLEAYRSIKTGIEADGGPKFSLLPFFIKALVEPGVLDWPQLIAKMTINPARVLGLPKGTLTVGADADVTVIDPELEWTIDPSQFRSKSRNTPFAGWRVRGRAVWTIVAGEVRFALDG